MRGEPAIVQKPSEDSEAQPLTPALSPEYGERGERPDAPLIFLRASKMFGHYTTAGLLKDVGRIPPMMSTNDPLAIRRIDHLRFFVGNARQSAYFYRNAFGFDVVAYSGLETKVKHEAGYVLKQGDITFVLISPLRPDHPEYPRLIRHGDGVMDIALEVDDVGAAFEESIRRGAIGVTPPSPGR